MYFKSLRIKVISSLVIILLFSSTAFVSIFAKEGCSDKWYDYMRELWEPAPSGFIQEWLLLGVFPNPSNNDEKVYDHTEPCLGCDKDYLTEHGGEKDIKPETDLAHKRPDGSVAKWFKHSSDNPIIDLSKAFSNQNSTNSLAYAFTTINRSKAGKGCLALGSDDGIMAWVNGKLVHKNIKGRSTEFDDDLVFVDFLEGQNTILLKIENGQYGWDFCARILDDLALEILNKDHFETAIISKYDDDLKVWVEFDHDQNELLLEVVKAGGTIVTSHSCTNAEEIIFSTTDWTPGCYEVRSILKLQNGEQKVKHHAWYKGNPAKTIKALILAAEKADQSTPTGMTIQMLADMVRDRLDIEQDNISFDDMLKTHSPLMEFEELQLLESGKGSPIRPYGFLRLAYRHDIDDSPQFCRAYLPPNYDPDKEWPLVVYLHGNNPQNPDYIKWWGIDSRHHSRAEDFNVVYIEPHGRGNTGYQGIGRLDVLRSIELAKEQFSIDENRVYLTGESMGGGGTWHVGSRHPELFAAIAPVFGGWDYVQYLDEDKLNRLTPREVFEHSKQSSFVQNEALLTTPIFVFHCTDDDIVLISGSRLAVRQLQRWNYNVRYWEMPGGSHFEYSQWPNIINWLLSHKLNSNPEHVRIRAADLNTASAHWVKVLHQANPLAFMQVEAKVSGSNYIHLKTTNVLAVSLAPGNELIDESKPLKILWNGVGYESEIPDDGSLTIYWNDFKPGKLVKQPGTSGPLDDAINTPFAIVVGTASKDPLMKLLCKREAQNIVSDWEHWQKQTPRLFNDNEISEQDLTNYTLFLIGGPDENLITRRLQNELPLKIENEIIKLGQQSFTAPDSAIKMIYPHPFNSKRYVVVMAATSPKGMFNISKFSENLDFYIDDGKYYINEDDDEENRGHTHIASGMFDNAWQVSEELIEYGDQEIRAAGKTRHTPKYITSEVEGNKLYLSDLLEKNSVNGFRYLERDLGLNLKPLTLSEKVYKKGLGVYPWSIPSTAEAVFRSAARIRTCSGFEFNL